MQKLPTVVFALLLVLAAAWIVSLTGRLPERVATHFDAAGVANGFMTRAQCRAFMLALTLGAPTLLAVVTGLVPRLVPASMINLPNRDYWLDPSRIDDALAYLSAQGIWFGCLLLLFLAAVDAMVATANATTPAQLPMRAFAWVLGLFAVAVVVWVVRMLARFLRPPR
jgi:hypothetical protein